MDAERNGEKLSKNYSETSLHREDFDEQGYLLFDSEVPLSILDGIVSDLHGKFDSTEPLDVSFRDPGRIQDAWKISSNVRKLSLAPKILQILRAFYQREPLPFQTLNFPRGTEQAIHSDTVHFNSIPSGYMCGVWVALEEIDMNNGPLVYYPGSHKFPEMNEKELNRASNLQAPGSSLLSKIFMAWRKEPPVQPEQRYAAYERFIHKQIEDSGLQPRYGVMKKGQALVWSANLLHGGATHLDKNRSRNSQVTHYFFEGCKYYTPLLSRPGKLQMRTPEWIR